MTIASDNTRLLTDYLTTRSTDSLNRLIENYIDFVHAAAHRQLRDPALADDVTQAVFIILTKKAQTIRPSTLPSWLFNTTRYCAANARRAEVRRQRHEHRAAKPEVAMSPDSALHDTADNLQSKLDDAIAHLSAADQQVVLLRYLQNLDFPQLSATIGISEPAARKRLTRAVNRLREYFTEQGIPATPAAVLTTLQAAPQHAPAHLLQSTTIAATTHSTAAASQLATHTLRLMTWLKLKIAAAIIAVAVGGITTTAIVHHVLADQPVAATAAQSPAIATPTSQPAEIAPPQLAKILPYVSFKATAFSDVLDFLRDVTALNIYADWGGLAAAGISRNAPVTYIANNKSAEQILNGVLNVLANKTRPIQFKPIGNLVVISSDIGLAELQKKIALSISPTTPAMKFILDSKLPTIRFSANSFADVIDYLRDVTHANIYVDWKTITIDRNAPVTLAAQNISLADSLPFIINAAANADPANKTTPRIIFKPLENILLISSEAEINSLSQSTDDDAKQLAEGKLLPVLTRKLPEIRFTANSLSDVIDFLRDVTQADIKTDWKSLESAGISRDTPITLNLHDTTLEQTLRLIIHEASTQHTKLEYETTTTKITLTAHPR